ncbi:MAG: hypothetical protein JST83_02175 [Bacteroidetes bacterium]|nr:hypothetical protein [Bacteroidota bacterium]
MRPLEDKPLPDKWPLKATLIHLSLILSSAEKENIYTLNQALLENNCYRQLWYYWKRKWAHNPDVIARICQIEQVFIVKLEGAAMTKQLNPTACFFILKHNFGYARREEDMEMPDHLMAEAQMGPEVANETAPPATEEEKKKGKDFSPRPGDNYIAASLRRDARRHPQQYSSIRPTQRRYMELAPDLYAYV